MTRTLAEIERDVQELSATERAQLLRLLIQNLDAPSDADAESAWLDECERRLDEIESGDARTHRAADVLREARARTR
jgi:putative addiction module component (TIGR02574 family)